MSHRKGAALVRRVTVDLTDPAIDRALDLQGITEVHAVRVVELTGPSTAAIKWNGADQPAIPVLQDDNRTGLDMTSLVLVAPGTGGRIELDVQGR